MTQSTDSTETSTPLSVFQDGRMVCADLQTTLQVVCEVVDVLGQ